MNQKQKKTAHAFCTEVKKSLYCPHAMKTVFLKELRGRISEFFDANPTATRAELEQSFGTPADIVSGFSSGEDLEALRRKAKRIIFYRIAVAVAIVVIALLLYVSVVVYQGFGDIVVTNDFPN